MTGPIKKFLIYFKGLKAHRKKNATFFSGNMLLQWY